jgi:hypothetical protein
VPDFDHLVHFWNPQSTCIDQRYEISFSVLLSACCSGCPAKDLLIGPQKNTEGYSILLHLDNALADNSQLSSDKIESAKAQRVSRPPVGLDPAPSDAFVFGYLKEKLRGTSVTTSDDLICAIGHIFSEIPEAGLKNVFTNWITRLSWMAKKGGEYYTK